MSPLDRSEKFQIRLTAEERQMLERLADHEGYSASDVIRRLVRAAYADVIGAPNARPAPIRAKRSAASKPKR